MTSKLPIQSVPIVIERHYHAQTDEQSVYRVSTEKRATDVLTDFYDKSLSMIRKSIKSTEEKYPKMFGL
jgi:hypothetical protein